MCFIDIRNLNVAQGGVIQIQFDVTLAASVVVGTVVTNQSALRLANDTTRALSDDPNVNGPANPDIAGENHGDRVIADALAYMMVDEQPRKGDLKELLANPPTNTYAWRQKETRDRLKKQGRYGTRRHR